MDTVLISLCIFSSLLSSITAISNLAASNVFLKKDFKNKRIFKYMSINSFIDGNIFVLGFTFPIALYFNEVLANLKWSFIYQFYFYYILICFGSFLKGFSENLNITIACYRLLEISKFRNLNKKINFNALILCLFLLSIITSIPVSLRSKLVRTTNGTMYERQENDLLIKGYNFTQISIYAALVLNIIKLKLILVPNVYIMLVLRNQYKKRKRLLQLSSNQAHRILSNNNETITCIHLLKIANQEIRVSLLVASISIIFVFDVIFKFISVYIAFNILKDQVYQKYGLLVIAICYSIFYSLNVLCYFCFNEDFRKNFCLLKK